MTKIFVGDFCARHEGTLRRPCRRQVTWTPAASWVSSSRGSRRTYEVYHNLGRELWRGSRSTALQLMSALGQKRTSEQVRAMSALPPKADIGTQSRNVRFVPIVLQKSPSTRLMGK